MGKRSEPAPAAASSARPVTFTTYAEKRPVHFSGADVRHPAHPAPTPDTPPAADSDG